MEFLEILKAIFWWGIAILLVWFAYAYLYLPFCPKNSDWYLKVF
jgi:multisubunit Na+/H+ antiporter MnhB subunit